MVTSGERKRLSDELPGAIERGEILAWYQPQLDIASGRIVAVEALSRWMHPELGILLPNVFIPLAEQNGSIHDLGTLMFDLGCRSAADWHARGMPIEVSINVSATQLERSGFEAHLVDCLEESGADAHALVLEITETQPIDDFARTGSRLRSLRELGFGISIDDFGTGHSTLEQVLRLPATEIKIDQSVVQDDPDGFRPSMASTVNLARLRGLRVVAEGIETSNQLELVRRLKCDRAQGFLIGPPGPRAEVEQLIFAGSSGA
ncbi:MAG: hypothetical protein JWO10_589 [Microbacteriaceae bacterium]|nr:hypothetical protein [Microbacteriaceae bacterium]